MLSSSAPLSAVVLAAGAGTRMRNDTPKPLTLLHGKPLIAYVIEALATLEPDRIVVVVGHGADQVSEAAQLAAPDPTRLEFAHQHEQRGTGDAVWVGLQKIPQPGPVQAGDQPSLVLVAPADAPLVRATTLRSLLEAQSPLQPSAQPEAFTDSLLNQAATLLTARVADPSGYGRIVRARNDRVQDNTARTRDDRVQDNTARTRDKSGKAVASKTSATQAAGGEVLAIVEHRDATDEQLLIDEINSSVYCFAEGPLRAALAEIMNAPAENAQNEIQLTDVVAVLRSHGHRVGALSASDASEVMGVNDSAQLAACEVELQRRDAGS